MFAHMGLTVSVASHMGILFFVFGILLGLSCSWFFVLFLLHVLPILLCHPCWPESFCEHQSCFVILIRRYLSCRPKPFCEIVVARESHMAPNVMRVNNQQWSHMASYRTLFNCMLNWPWRGRVFLLLLEYST